MVWEGGQAGADGGMDDDACGEEQGALFEVRCDRPFLVAGFREPQAVLSWAVARPGFRVAREVAWLEVREAELPEGVDHEALLARRLAAAGLEDAVAMMTSRDVRRHRLASARSGGIAASCLATVGLRNAVRVGAPRAVPARPGTVNLLAAVSVSLSEAALVEAVSIAAEARTAAIIDAAWPTAGGLATGTGTDCIVVAASAAGADRPRAEAFAGLHTRVGEALGAAVYEAVGRGAREWIAEHGRPPAVEVTDGTAGG